jgi:hypothetical protein
MRKPPPFPDMLKFLANDPNGRKRLGMANRQITEHRPSREMVSRKFEQELKGICGV